jgi:hypothetical protein
VSFFEVYQGRFHNIRLGYEWLRVTNTLAYYIGAKAIKMKRLFVHGTLNFLDVELKLNVVTPFFRKIPGPGGKYNKTFLDVITSKSA